MNVVKIARRMYDRVCSEYDPDPSMVEHMWHEDPGVKAFWIAQAEAVAADLRVSASWDSGSWWA